MGRTKIDIDITALGLRTKQMSLIVGSNTAASDVISKVLEKLRMQDHPSTFQLFAMEQDSESEKGRVLGDEERLAQVLKNGTHWLKLYPSHSLTSSPASSKLLNSDIRQKPPPPLHSSAPSANALIRVYYDSERGIQTFHSLIATPSMTSTDVLESALPVVSPSGEVKDYMLVLVTPGKDIQLKPHDCPLAFGSSSRFEIRKIIRRTPTRIIPRMSASSSRSPSLDVSTSMNGSNGYGDLSSTELLTGKLRLHAELIKALQDFTAQSTTEGLFETSGAMSRETVLEQALVEQNHILDVMQELIATLESENKQSRERINKQGRLMSGLEVKLRQNEKIVAELRTRSNVLSQQGSMPAIAELKRQLNSKEQEIATLQTKLSRESESMLSAKLASAKTKLEVERVRCIEFEEELAQVKVSLSRLNREIEEKNSKLFKNESEISHMTHEVESMRKFEQQQQELVANQRSTLSNKDMQIRSLTRALNKEKKVADQLRRIQVGTSGLSPSPKLGNTESQNSLPNLFEQLAGRAMFSFELTRITPESELGFSFAKVGPGRNQSLIVKHVKEGSMAGGFLTIGDELLEVNGLQCRSFQQLRAINALEKGSGILRIVIARAPDSAVNNRVFHGTPSKFPISQSADETSSVWSTALHVPNATFQNFSGSMDDLHSMDARFVRVPESISQSTTPNSSSDQLPNGIERERTEENANYQDTDEKTGPGTPLSTSSVHETESLVTLSSREEVSVKKLQYEVADLQDQLDESERLRIEFESTLDTTREDLAHTKSDNETLQSENSELNQLLLARDKEINEIQQYISELQSALVVLQSKVVDDQQKIGTLENHNKNLTAELSETRTNSKEDIQLKENLRDIIKNLKLKLEQSKKMSVDLEARYQDQRLEKAHLASAVALMENTLQSLQDSVETSKHESEAALSAVKQECQILQSQLEEVTEVSHKAKAISQEQYEHLNEQLKSAKSLLAESELKCAQMQVDLRYHKQAADQANKELENLEPKHHKIVDELHFYKQEAERKTLEIESMNVNLKSAQSKLDGKQQMTIRLQNEVDTLRRTNASLKNDVVQQREKAKEMEVNLRASKSEEIQLAEKLRASADEKDDMFVQLEKSFEESSELTLTIDMLKTEMEELKKQDNAHSKDTVEEIIQSSKLAEAQLKGELESSQKKVGLLSSQIVELKSETKTCQIRIETVDAELKKEKSEKLALEAAKEETTKELAELLEKNAHLYSESDSKLQELDEANSVLVQLKEQLKLQEDHAASYLAKLAEMELELEKVRSDYQKEVESMSSLEFIQKQQEEKLKLANSTIFEKEKVIKLKNKEIDDINDRFQNNATESTALAESLASLKQQLKESQLTYEESLKRLQDELSSKDKMLVSVNNDLKMWHSKEEILTARIEYLTGSLEKVTKEKKSLEDSTEVGAKLIEELQSHDNQLTSQIDRVKGKLSNTIESNDLLSSEVASLRHQLRHNEKEADQLLAQLNAAEINLEVCHKTISENEKLSASRSERMNDLETRYEEECSKTKELGAKVSSCSLEICSRDEEISKLTTTVDLRQQDSAALQTSLVAVQAEFDKSKKKIDNLHAECKQLHSCLKEANESKKGCEQVIQELENEISGQKKLKEKESELHQFEVKSLKVTEEELHQKLKKLEQENQNLERARNELESARADLKESVNKVGNKKDLEIVKLQEEVSATANKSKKVEEERDMLIQKEIALQDSMQELKGDMATLMEELEKERDINSTLRDEMKVHEETAKDIQGLNERVSFLDDNVKEKSERLIELEESLSTSDSNVKSLQADNEALLEKLSELVSLKHTAAEQSEEIAESKKKLEKMNTEYKQVLKERDQFLSTVRKLEIKHHETLPLPTKAAPTKVSAGEDDMLKMQQLLDEREDEIIRTRKYTEELLINVMMKAPFLLEK